MRRVFVDNLTLRVADLAASRAFYADALAPLGAGVVELDGGEVALELAPARRV